MSVPVAFPVALSQPAHSSLNQAEWAPRMAVTDSQFLCFFLPLSAGEASR
jgi:hypothetical protein